MEVNLVVVGGKQAGRVIPVPGPRYVIGRADDCQMRPQSDRVSRRHCEIRIEQGRVVVRDCGSKNGTFVNGQRLEGEHELKGGDHLQVGPLEFEVQLTVSVSGKKKPKVHNVREAAARTVETGAGEEPDISGWLDEEDEGEKQGPAAAAMHDTTMLSTSGDTGAAPAAAEDAAAKKAAEPEHRFGPPKKMPPTLFNEKPEEKHLANSSRDAAADMLKQFFHRK